MRSLNFKHKIFAEISTHTNNVFKVSILFLCLQKYSDPTMIFYDIDNTNAKWYNIELSFGMGTTTFYHGKWLVLVSLNYDSCSLCTNVRWLYYLNLNPQGHCISCYIFMHLFVGRHFCQMCLQPQPHSVGGGSLTLG